MSKKHHISKTASSAKPSHHNRAPHHRNLTPWLIGLAVLVLIGVPFLLLQPKRALPSEVQVTQAFDMYQKGAFFLDVRTQAEWDQGHIARSILIPLDELQTRLNEIPRDKDIVVVCRSGDRSKEGATILRQAGFTRVTCMNGGLQAWLTGGYPVTN